MVDIGEKIEMLLKKKRLSKKDLIEALDVTRSGLYHKIKHDSFKAEELEILSKFFDVDVDFFTEEQQSKPDADSKIQIILERFVEEISLLRQQLQKKDEHIDKLLAILGKLEVSPEMPPVREGAVVLPLHGKRGFVANSRANSCAVMIA